MDFTFTPEAEDAAKLAADLLTKQVTPELLKSVDAQDDRYDHELWQDLADAGLLSLAIPESYGGADLGLLEAVRVLVEVGRVVAPIPAAPQVACVQAITELGTDEQKELWLYGAATGERRIMAATTEPLEFSPDHPGVTAAQDGDVWRLDGVKMLVRGGTQADALLVTATTDSGSGVFIVELPADGAEIEVQRTSDGDAAALVTLTDVEAEPLGALDGSAARRLVDLLTITSCAELLGVTEGALKLTAAYATTREQFGRPIGIFQGVRHRLADGHMDVLAQRLTLWQAAWRVAEGLPAEVEIATAKLWAADAAHRIAHTTVHVHGGVGIDLDGEAHRFFTAAKRHEFAFGGATEQALAIGRAFASA